MEMTPAMQMSYKLLRMKHMHQGDRAGLNKKGVEAMAWKNFKSLEKAQILSCEKEAITYFFHAWNYFEKHWENGAEGPADVNAGRFAQPEEATPSAQVGGADGAAAQHATQ